MNWHEQRKKQQRKQVNARSSAPTYGDARNARGE